MSTSVLDSPRNATRLERRKARTRASILEAARHLFQEHGFESTSIAQIAEAADSGVGTLYGYFSNKDEILREVLRSHGEQVTREFLESVNDATPALERICLALDGFTRYLRENRVLLLSAFRAESRSQHDDDSHSAWLTRAFSRILRDGIESSEFRPVPPDATSRSLISAYTMAILGIGHWKGFENDPQTARDLEAMTRLMLSPA